MTTCTPAPPVSLATTVGESSSAMSIATSRPRPARGLRQLVGRPRRAEDGASHRVRELHRRRADAAADGVDQHPLARPDAGPVSSASCAVMNASGTAAAGSKSRFAGIGTAIRAWVTTYSAWQPPADDPEDAVADLQRPGHARPERVDLARELQARDVGRRPSERG